MKGDTTPVSTIMPKSPAIRRRPIAGMHHHKPLFTTNDDNSAAVPTRATNLAIPMSSSYGYIAFLDYSIAEHQKVHATSHERVHSLFGCVHDRLTAQVK